MSYDLCLHVDANDPAVLAFAFVNARNYMNGLPGKEFELVLVANGRPSNCSCLPRPSCRRPPRSSWPAASSCVCARTPWMPTR